MTLFQLARKNMVGNAGSYLIYFVSMLVSVVIYYTFVSLRYSDQMAEIVQFSDAVESIFMQASIILILFVAVFIWYSNGFFTRKRKKEIGLYSLLGMRKKTIGKLLFFENLLIGIVVLAAGIAAGTFLSKLFTMILVKLVGSGVQVKMTLSLGAILNTLIVFAILLLVTSFQSYRLVYRFTLLELFQAERKGDKPPRISPTAAAIAVALIGGSYWLLFQPLDTIGQYYRNLLLFLAGIVSGTYLLFRFVIIVLLRFAQSRKASYYRGMNLVSVSQLMYRIQGNARIFTMIGLLSAFTITSISTVYVQYYTSAERAEAASPFSYMHLSKGEAFDAQVKGILLEDKSHPIVMEQSFQVLEAKAKLSDWVYIGEDEGTARLMSAGDYNAISDALGREAHVSLAGNEVALVRQMNVTLSADSFLGRQSLLQLGETGREVMFKETAPERVFEWRYPDLTIVVSDSLFAELKASGSVPIQTYKAYKVDTQRSTKATFNRLNGLGFGEGELTSYYQVYKRGLEQNGLDIFLFGFLGLVFLAATGSMLYFKQLTEAQGDKERYDILRKIGASTRDIRRSIARQTRFVFGLPLAVGIMHSLMILKVIGTLTERSLLVPVLVAFAAYLVIYVLYYGLTVHSYNAIANRSPQSVRY
ncbi:ABC transporter permease [Paenibacillus koleovorans]|uniref:ABC transporter permease n=1 Tax=Paenibacillus koleovorans TaxID=121608 RepID=UPI000FD99936|nr:ABC transporter permease [Paenibacillus koleovorans]